MLSFKHPLKWLNFSQGNFCYGTTFTNFIPKHQLHYFSLLFLLLENIHHHHPLLPKTLVLLDFIFYKVQQAPESWNLTSWLPVTTISTGFHVNICVYSLFTGTSRYSPNFLIWDVDDMNGPPPWGISCSFSLNPKLGTCLSILLCASNPKAHSNLSPKVRAAPEWKNIQVNSNKHFHNLLYFPQKLYGTGTIIWTLQLKKLRHREIM